MSLSEIYKENFMNTYSQQLSIVKGDGSHLFDSNGKSYIDFTSGIGVSSLGYGNEKLKEGIKTQVDTLMHCSNIFFNDSTILAGEALVKASGMKRVFFSNSGAESNEGAIKLARKYSFDKYGHERNVIVTLKQSFHGRTMATLTATGQDKFHNYFFPLPEGFEYFEKNDISALENLIKSNKVCAVMLEAIQGEGGVYPLEKAFVKKVVNLCNENDVLVIFDEVQCGIGRTGKFFGYQHFAVKPDIVTVAKGLGGGLPIGAVLAGEKAEATFKPGDHGSTFGGNPVACKAASIVIGEVTSNGFMDEVYEKGQYIMNKLKALNLPSIKAVRGIGLMIGIEVEGLSKEVQQKCTDKGLLVLTAGEKVVRLLPPLTISYEDINRGLDILMKCL